MTVIHIDSIDDDRLEHYRNLKQTSQTCESGLFVAEGKRIVHRLLESRFETVSVMVSEDRLDEFAGRVPEHVPMYVVSRQQASELIGFRFHYGAMACGRRQPAASPASMLAPLPAPTTLVICPATTDPENLGSIIRSATIFGAQGVLLGEKCADPFSRRALRVSMASALRIPIAVCSDLAAKVRQLQRTYDLELIACELGEDSQPITESRRKPRTGLLFGNEAQGLEPDWMRQADRSVMIPVQDEQYSLNVSAAAAVTLYHFCRLARSTAEKS